ncbi:MAG: DUF4179 domain-containing protein [Chloroflexi bacterium]|nr:DUF4179 domain-containing protein [Chloroflexota bacterium]
MKYDERIEAEAQSKRLDAVLSGTDQGTDLDPELDEVTRLVVEAEQVPPLEPATRARLWTNALQLALEENARGWRVRRDGPPRIRSVRLPASWLPRGWRIIPAIVALLLMAAVAYAAVSPLVQRIWQTSPGLSHVAEAGFVQELNLSQTHHDMTITLERAYADPSLVAIASTVAVPESFAAEHTTPRVVPELVDSEGRRYSPTGGRGAGEVNGAAARLDFFSVPELPSNTREVTFTLTFPQLSAAHIVDDRRVRIVTLPGPWEYRFILPLVRGRVIEPQSSVTSEDVTIRCDRLDALSRRVVENDEGEKCVEVRSQVDGMAVTLTLERVSAAPSATVVRFRVTSIPEAPDGPNWQPVGVRLKGDGCLVGGDPTEGWAAGNPYHIAPGVWQAMFDSPPGAPGTECTFRVDAFTLHSGDPTDIVRMTGPWEFHFRLP